MTTKPTYYYRTVRRILNTPISTVSIEPTNVCNLHCQICFSQKPKLHKPRKRGFMSWELYKKIIDELSNYGYKINLGLNFGGESLLHKRIIDMLNYASSKNTFDISFNTNATMLNDDIVQALIDNKITNITISLDGVDQIHEQIREGSNYALVEQNVLNLIDKRKYKKNPQVIVNMTINKQTPNDILEFVNRWINVADRVELYPLISEDMRIVNPKFFYDLPVEKNKYCFWPFGYISILWNGDVTTCCHDINGINIIGNVTSKKIKAILASLKYIKFRYSTIFNRFSPKSNCFKCNVWQIRLLDSTKLIGNIKIQYGGTRKTITKICHQKVKLEYKDIDALI